MESRLIKNRINKGLVLEHGNSFYDLKKCFKDCVSSFNIEVLSEKESNCYSNCIKKNINLLIIYNLELKHNLT